MDGPTVHRHKAAEQSDDADERLKRLHDEICRPSRQDPSCSRKCAALLLARWLAAAKLHYCVFRCILVCGCCLVDFG